MIWIMRIKFRIRSSVLMLFLLMVSCSLFSQSKVSNNNGLSIVNHRTELKEEIIKNSNNRMVDLRKAMPFIVLDLKYATKDNFMRQKLYPRIRTTYLRSPAAEALKKVMNELQAQGLGIKVWDAYRPYNVTELMWKKIKDSRYVADPSKGSGHNRGISVDLTLINLTSGRELPMPTGFDNFTDTAHADFPSLSQEVLANRKLLKTVMEKYGFIALDTEWWHFYLPASSDFSVLNLSFKQLGKAD